MKTKKKNTFTRIVRYTRELSIVVAGIAITFLVNDCIGRRNEKNDMMRYLNAVKVELQENLSIIEEKTAFYDKTAALSRYLRSDKPENLSSDSIAAYSNVATFFFTTTFKTSAFETLKMSGTMRLLDETLLTYIIDCYRVTDEVKSNSDSYMQRKMDELYTAIIDNEEVNTIDLLSEKQKRLFYFFTIHVNIEQSFRDCADQLQATLDLIEECE